ncbi:MAG: ketoacyl-ACP synthase III [Rhodospirillales bacterium]|nr:ketoacyl-ACP synthase III [Rhodospirillales bacterium]MCB9973525.1 ketoacyl-ACP synthase III [Rhodospirillales bacterium]MCB9980679.1 ketoacyl-ACP synthase III [Rhodospirillales bacterium]
MKRTRIAGTGSYLPQKILTNKDLESIVETTDEWIVQRTGIRERHIAAEDEQTSDMAVVAARQALAHSGLSGADIDGVIVATATADRPFPSVAVAVQDALAIGKGPSFDMQAACCGFVYALSTADSLIKNGIARRLLVIGAEKFSSLLDWSDRRTCVLFGDGAGAVILEACDGQGTSADQGILSAHLHADGQYQGLLHVPSETGFIEMDGPEVFKFAVNSMSGIVAETLESTGLEAADIDWLVPHQANIRIIEATARKLKMSMDQVVVTVDRHGNTSAASIPLAFHEAVSSGNIKRGQVVLFEALGGGMTWGSVLMRF